MIFEVGGKSLVTTLNGFNKSDIEINSAVSTWIVKRKYGRNAGENA